MPRVFLAFLGVLSFFWNLQIWPQNMPAPSTAAVSRPPADEVDSVEHISAAAYKLVSGPSGSRDWDHFRSLFLPGAQFITTHRDSSGKISSSIFTTDEFIQRAQTIFDKQGFYESPIANRIEVWDRIAHVWSTYESRHSRGEKPYTRGVNSMQLLNDGTRWWIVTICWENEDASQALPDEYLK